MWSTYIAIEDCTLLKALGLVIVVDAEFSEQNLILVRGNSAGQSLLCILSTHTTFLDKGPERGIVQIVDVT